MCPNLCVLLSVPLWAVHESPRGEMRWLPSLLCSAWWPAMGRWGFQRLLIGRLRFKVNR
jgi:hypothetical protein